MKIPFALTHDEWDEWKSDARKSHPVWYWFHWTLPIFFGRILHRLRDAKWWVLHRIVPRHRYHIARTGLAPGYYDPDTVILHAAFTQLENFYKHWDWKGDPKAYADAHCEHVKGEARTFIYKRRLHFASTVEELHSYWITRTESACINREQQSKRDDKMLHKLITVRGGLWN